MTTGPAVSRLRFVRETFQMILPMPIVKESVAKRYLYLPLYNGTVQIHGGGASASRAVSRE